MLRRLKLLLCGVGLVTDRGTWLEEDRVLACAYPRNDDALAGLATQGISVVINLHERPHPAEGLARFGLTEVHIPVPDFTPPVPEQIDLGIRTIHEALAAGRRVAVHCGAGLGRTGTLLACYLVSRGREPDAAIAEVRSVRPGSVETREQVLAVRDYAARLRGR